MIKKIKHYIERQKKRFSTEVVHLSLLADIEGITWNPEARYIVGGDLVFNTYGDLSDLGDLGDMVLYQRLPIERLSLNSIQDRIKKRHKTINVYVHKLLLEAPSATGLYLAIGAYKNLVLKGRGSQLIIGGSMQEQGTNLEILFAQNGRIKDVSERSLHGTGNTNFWDELQEELVAIRKEHPSARITIVPPLDPAVVNRFKALELGYQDDTLFLNPFIPRIKSRAKKADGENLDKWVRYRYALPVAIFASSLLYATGMAAWSYSQLESAKKYYQQALTEIGQAPEATDIELLRNRNFHITDIKNGQSDEQFHAHYTSSLADAVSAISVIPYSIIDKVAINQRGRSEVINITLAVPKNGQLAALEQAEQIVLTMSNGLQGRVYINNPATEALRHTMAGRNALYRIYDVHVERSL